MSYRRLINEGFSQRDKARIVLFLRSSSSLSLSLSSPILRSSTGHELRVQFRGAARCQARRRIVPGKTLSSSSATDRLSFSLSLSLGPIHSLLILSLSHSRLPLSLAQREMAFRRRFHTKIATRLCSTTVRSAVRSIVFLLSTTFCSPCSGFCLLINPLSEPLLRLTAETCITDSSKLLPLIALSSGT